MRRLPAAFASPPRVSALVAALLPLAACSHGVDKRGAQAIFESLVIVNADLPAAIDEASQSSAARSANPKSEYGSEGSYSFSKSIDGGVLWTGSVEVSGSGEVISFKKTEDLDAYKSFYDFSADYVDVQPLDPEVLLNGSLDTSLYSACVDDGSFFHLNTSLDGKLRVEGDAEGEAPVHVVLDLEYDADSATFSYSAEGDIGDYEVSAFVADLEAAALGE